MTHTEQHAGLCCERFRPQMLPGGNPREGDLDQPLAGGIPALEARSVQGRSRVGLAVYKCRLGLDAGAPG